MSTERRSLLLAACLLLPALSQAEPQPTNVSTATLTLDLTPPDPFSAFSADRMVALPDGTRFVLGGGASNSANANYLLKVNPNGTQAWAVSVADPFTAEITGLAADASGNAYVAYTDFSNFSEPHARVVKYNAAGGAAASADLTTDTPGGDGFPFSEGVGVDSARGRVYAAYSFFSNVQSQNTFAVAALDTDLQPVASRVYDPGFTGSIGVFPDGGTLVDGVGDVWVVALQAPPAGDAQLLAARFTPDVASVSPLALASPSVEEVGGTADPRGGIVAAGDRQADGNLYLHRVTASGGFGGQFRFDGFDFVPSPMAVDPAGNLYIIGFDPGNFFPAVAKVDASDSLAWDQPGPYLGLPETFSPGAVAAASSATFDVASVDFNVDPIPVVLLHYQQAASSAPANLVLEPLSPVSQDATVTKTLSAPLKVKVTEGGVPREGVTVRWEFVALPPGTTGQDLLEAPGFPSTVVASRDVPTNADGESAVQVKLGDLTGEYLVAANVVGAAPSSIAFTVRGELFMDIRLSTTSIKPVPFSQIVNADNQLTVMVHAFGVGGSTDVVADYPAAVFSAPVSNSGGHDHAAGRPGGTFSGIGLAVFTSSATGRTDAGGDLFAVFTSTYFSGSEIFFASSTIDASVISPSTTAVIKAGDFVLLEDATYYIKDGGTCFHHGPAGPSGCITPDQDHYGTPSTTATIAAIAAEWLTFAGPSLMLEINDLSLPLGGGFDVKGNWSDDIVKKIFPPQKGCNPVGHCSHRDGRNIDIQIRGDINPNRLRPPQWDRLQRIIRNRGGRGTIIFPEGSHQHISFPR